MKSRQVDHVAAGWPQFALRFDVFVGGRADCGHDDRAVQGEQRLQDPGVDTGTDMAVNVVEPHHRSRTDDFRGEQFGQRARPNSRHQHRASPYKARAASAVERDLPEAEGPCTSTNRHSRKAVRSSGSIRRRDA